MRDAARITVLIPALNEVASIGKVLADIPDWVDDVIVGDNGSTDGTVEVAQKHGATVVVERRRGYGSACLKAMAAMQPCDVVVFLDGDYSDYPEQMDRLVDPIIAGKADMVIGSRVLGHHARGALTPQARFGNWLACFLIRLFWGVRYTDLGPFRAIRYSTLQSLDMADPDYGWTVEMQIKAVLRDVTAMEAPVDYRKRIGRSKVSGTVRGIVGAGYKILSTIFISAAHHRFDGKNHAPERRLAIFTRYPEPGNTKTRLIPALGPSGAADLQRSMTEHTVGVCAELEDTGVEIRYVGAEESAMRHWLGDSLQYREQGEGDLGHRMARTFFDAFEVGANEVVIIGIDCPEITGGIIEAAFGALRTHEVVLGPATDGGYYLIGLRKSAMNAAIPRLFEGPEWGSDSVLRKTLELAAERRLHVRQLVPLDDVDRPEDLSVWERARMDEDDRPEVSVIVPTLNEAARIGATLGSVMGINGVEVIVVDGESDDDTAAIVGEMPVTLLSTPAGRARQMNLGASRASGKVVLFLHGDTLLPKGFVHEVREVMRSGATLGAFRFQTDDSSAAIAFISRWANFRSTWLAMPYGDQGLFMARETFRDAGGFEDYSIMEDYALVRALAKRGRVQLAKTAVTTSSRRWKTFGPFRTTLYNQIAMILYVCGVSPDRIARFYDRARGTS